MFEGLEETPGGRPRVKICGITNKADACAAGEFGADAIGLNFYQGSRRYLELSKARGWISDLPARLVKIGVVVNPSEAEALELSNVVGLAGLQLHGQETTEFCRWLAGQQIRFAKALPVVDRQSLANATGFYTQTIVLDSYSPRGFGGSGRTFPWEIAAEFAAANPEIRIILAGGLTPENVAAAVAAVRPFAVDVTSGVESSPGRKDHGLLRAFIAAAHSA